MWTTLPSGVDLSRMAQRLTQDQGRPVGLRSRWVMQVEAVDPATGDRMQVPMESMLTATTPLPPRPRRGRSFADPPRLDNPALDNHDLDVWPDRSAT